MEKETTIGMRTMLYAASMLVFLVGVQLYVLSNYTEQFFAWKVQPPLTAATLGAAYWASCLLELFCARQKSWSRARVAVPAVLLFTTLTMAVSLIHLDAISTGTFRGMSWMIVYGAVPPIMGLLLARQIMARGEESPRIAPLPVWYRLMMEIQGGFMIALGIVYLLEPRFAVEMWPWKLSPLTARLIGAWLVGIGLSLAHSVWENDWQRIWPPCASLTLLGVLELGALLRYPEAVRWQRTSAYVYLASVISLLAMGVIGLIQCKRTLRDEDADGRIDGPYALAGRLRENNSNIAAP